MLAKIFACQPAVPGTAQLMIRLRGEQSVLASLTFCLCNNEQYYLQPDSNWSPAPHWFTIDGGYPLSNGIGFRIGPTLLNPLLERASQVQIQVKLASGETRSTTLQMVRDELFSSDARGQTGNYSSSSVLSTPAPVPAPEAQPEVAPAQPAIAPQPVQDTRPPKRSVPLIPIVAGILIVLLIVAGALWWFMGRDTSAPTPEPVNNQAEAPAPAAPAEPAAPATPAAAEAKPEVSACSVANLNSQSELDFVQNCVQQKLDSAALLTIIQAAKEAKKCGVAQRLYANRAQGGDTQIALAYATEYDPKDHKPSECFKTPDPDTAAYWYETVLQTEPDNQKAKQRLEELGK